MTYRVIWSDFAELQLDSIFNYYLEKVSSIVAYNLVEEIISEPFKIAENPTVAQREELLMNRENEYRYLVCRNYKIIFSIDVANKLIKVADVFDTRQNPSKIKRVK
jgi:plasmid stabilization system protein ParE